MAHFRVRTATSESGAAGFPAQVEERRINAGTFTLDARKGVSFQPAPPRIIERAPAPPVSDIVSRPPAPPETPVLVGAPPVERARALLETVRRGMVGLGGYAGTEKESAELPASRAEILSEKSSADAPRRAAAGGPPATFSHQRKTRRDRGRTARDLLSSQRKTSPR